MLATILIALGLLSILFGGLCILAGIIPRFGGDVEPHALPIGCGFIALGLWLIFKAGSAG